MSGSVAKLDVLRVDASGSYETADVLAVEEPLEIRVLWSQDNRPRLSTVSVTMRTPGDDAALAVGYLFTEGIVQRREEIADVSSCLGGAIRVELAEGVVCDLSRLERNSYTSASCGACGKTSVAALRATPPWSLHSGEPVVDTEVLRGLPQSLREAQVLFATTGGLHASALYDLEGRLITLREDVGRHNALDKVIGAELLAARLPAHERILIVSGRVSFELVQKALMAAIPVVVAIGAPSSLAVELAREAGMTLLGFVRSDRFNVYSGGDRLVVVPSEAKDDMVV